MSQHVNFLELLLKYRQEELDWLNDALKVRQELLANRPEYHQQMTATPAYTARRELTQLTVLQRFWDAVLTRDVPTHPVLTSQLVTQLGRDFQLTLLPVDEVCDEVVHGQQLSCQDIPEELLAKAAELYPVRGDIIPKLNFYVLSSPKGVHSCRYPDERALFCTDSTTEDKVWRYLGTWGTQPLQVRGPRRFWFTKNLFTWLGWAVFLLGGALGYVAGSFITPGPGEYQLGYQVGIGFGGGFITLLICACVYDVRSYDRYWRGDRITGYLDDCYSPACHHIERTTYLDEEGKRYRHHYLYLRPRLQLNTSRLKGAVA